MAGAPPISYTLAHERTFDVTTLANGRRKFSDDGGAPKLACAYLLKADPANSVNVLIGEGNGVYPLEPGETSYSDLPPGVLTDISRLEARTVPATTGQIVHVRFWEIVGNPPQGTAKPNGEPADLNGPHDSYAGAGA